MPFGKYRYLSDDLNDAQKAPSFLKARMIDEATNEDYKKETERMEDEVDTSYVYKDTDESETSPIRQKPSFSLYGSDISLSNFGTGTMYHPRTRGGKDELFEPTQEYGEAPGSYQSPDWKLSGTLAAGLDFGALNIFAGASKSRRTYFNKPDLGFQPDPDYIGTTIQTQDDLGNPVTISGERDIAGSTKTSYGDLVSTKLFGGGQLTMGGKRKGGLMAILSGEGGLQKTEQKYETDVATGKPISTAGNMGFGYAGGGVGSIDPYKGEYGTTSTGWKGTGKLRLDLGYGSQGSSSSGGCFGGSCYEPSRPSYFAGLFGEHGTEGTKFGAKLQHGAFSGEVSKILGQKGLGFKGSISIPLSWSKKR